MTEKNENTPEAEPANSDPRKRRKTLIILATLVMTGVLIGVWMWAQSQIYISTDNAFVEAPVHQVSARISGQVLQVQVKDNQTVKAGDLLVELDPVDYTTAVRKAQAQLDQARNQTSGEYAQIGESNAAVSQAEATLTQARLDLRRGEALLARDVVSLETVDRTRTNVRLAEARLRQAQETRLRAVSQAGMNGLGGNEARIAQRQAEYDEALTNLERTHIVAPADGYVTHKAVEIGNNVRSGQALLSIVQLDESWVVANLKETQLTHVRPGQPVSMTCDALPGEKLHGVVESIMAGTGAAFSLLPPENATGNYVKVVQRVPVKIRFVPESGAEQKVRVGMSVIPVIDTGRRLGDLLSDLNPFN